MSTIYQPTDLIAQGRYEIISLIGEGGAGIVYQCIDKPSNTAVAIKVLRPELIEDKKQIEIFRQEARLAAKLLHPNIVGIYEINTEEWQGKQIHYLVMEYLPGGNLTTKIKSGVRVSESLLWMKQLLDAISFAHEQGIIHQDIKSANVFLDGNGSVKIGDFGLARLITGNAPSFVDKMTDSQARALAQRMGTPAYMSPELCFGEIQDERSDIYSLGILFFEMLVGKVPFEAPGMIELARLHISKPVPSLCRINPAIPQMLDEMIKRMLAKDKNERFQSIKQIKSVIDSL